MKLVPIIIALLLPVTAWAEPLRLLPFTAWAQALPVPRQPGPGGGCPIAIAGRVATASRSVRAAAAKAVCPWGWAASGSYGVKI